MRVTVFTVLSLALVQLCNGQVDEIPAVQNVVNAVEEEPAGEAAAGGGPPTVGSTRTFQGAQRTSLGGPNIVPPLYRCPLYR